MSSEDQIKKKIDQWKVPITIEVGGFRIRDIHAERLKPLELDMRQLHEVYVESQKKRGTTNEQQK
jgi:hypothetical protein